MNVKVINHSKHELPKYETDSSSGVDLRANIEKSVVIEPMERTIVKTGLFLEIPQGFEAQVRPRSGLAIKHGITVINSPGTIDADYRGEIAVALVNLSKKSFTVNDGDRIAQLVFAKVEQATWKTTDSLTKTERGSGGFGSTGIK